MNDIPAPLAERDQLIRGLRAVIAAAGEIGTAGDLGRLLQMIMTRGRELLGCEACSLMLLDAETNELVFKVAQSQVGAELTDAFRIPVGQGVAGWVAQHRQHYLTNDAYQCDLFSPEADHATGFHTQAILCVPLIVEGRLIGVAQVLNPLDQRPFTEIDVSLFSDLATISGVAIENTRLRSARDELGRLEQEMELAREIQDSFLRHSFPDIPGYVVRAGTRPATWVGGDLYDVQVLASGEVALLVGDVSGKGASSSLHGARTLSEIRLFLEFCTEPDEVMSRLNNLMYERSSRGMFVTLLLLLLQPKTGHLRLISAGHPAPLIFDRDRDAFIDLRLPKAPPLGVLPDVRFRTQSIELPPRSLLLAFSDGIIDARNLAGADFSLERLRQTVRAAAGDPAAFLRIRDSVVKHVGRARQHDDATLLLLERGGDHEN